jgi:hypothetical protein
MQMGAEKKEIPKIKTDSTLRNNTDILEPVTI